MLIEKNIVYFGDCLEVMEKIPDKSIDMILCDLPYGTTACKWDTIIPFEPLWKAYNRIAKDTCHIVLTAAQPFTSALVMSNIKRFKHEWVWEKTTASGHLNAKRKPMRLHEDILVFNNGKYFPQGLHPYNKITRSGANSENYGKNGKSNLQEFTNYPRTIIKFKADKRGLHPTQKPVALFEYLIKTYTNEGDLVLDNCAGSGTTAIACINTKRDYILIEKEEKYFQICKERIKNCEQKLF